MAPAFPLEAPTRFGVVLFPQYEILDIAGPLEALNVLARLDPSNSVSLTLLAEDKSAPVSSGPIDPAGPGTLFRQGLVATHSFKECPPLDVLLVPGGMGAGLCDNTSDAVPAVVEFIQKVYPSLKYLITVCNGAGLAARAGVLDGKTCTTNKVFWSKITPLGPKTHWLAKARWVVCGEGKVWTTSGVSAGTDGTIAWISTVYGEPVAEWCCHRMEYIRTTDPGDDPFADRNGAEDVSSVH